MARKGAWRLKVFQTQLGFDDSVVAAPSQAAALRAWGVKQNLFGEGQSLGPGSGGGGAAQARRCARA